MSRFKHPVRSCTERLSFVFPGSVGDNSVRRQPPHASLPWVGGVAPQAGRPWCGRLRRLQFQRSGLPTPRLPSWRSSSRRRTTTLNMPINNLAGLHGETSWVSTMHGVSWVQKWQVLSHLQNQISSLSQCERSYGIQSIGQRFQVAYC